MRRPLSLVLALVLGALAASGAAAAQEPETVGIRLAEAPQNRADDPRARLYIVDHLAPGTTINRKVEVSNNTRDAQHVVLYAGSASIEEGGFRFGDGREPN